MKPKIYSHCDAGCKWETVHKSDFETLAPFVRVAITNQSCNLEIGKLYRIRNLSEIDGWDFTIEFTYFKEDVIPEPMTYTFELPKFNSKEAWVDFKLLEVKLAEGQSSVIITTYEINGEKHEDEIVVEDYNNSYVVIQENQYLNVNTVGGREFSVYLKQEGIEWVLVPHKVFIRYGDDINGTNMTDEYRGQKYIGMYTGEQASLNPNDYTWAKFVGEDCGVDAVLATLVDIENTGGSN